MCFYRSKKLRKKHKNGATERKERRDRPIRTGSTDLKGRFSKSKSDDRKRLPAATRMEKLRKRKKGDKTVCSKANCFVTSMA